MHKLRNAAPARISLINVSARRVRMRHSANRHTSSAALPHITVVLCRARGSPIFVGFNVTSFSACSLSCRAPWTCARTSSVRSAWTCSKSRKSWRVVTAYAMNAWPNCSTDIRLLPSALNVDRIRRNLQEAFLQTID